MNNEIDELIQKFKDINKQGYIKSIVKSKNGAGITFEHLVGAFSEDLPIPDYKGIELKAIRNYKFAEFDLFNASPDGKYVYPSQWISQNFGYPDKDYKNINVFKGNIDAKNFNKIGLFYYFKLKVDKLNKRIILEIYNNKKVLINNDIYWDFDTLKSKLELKLKKLAIIDVQTIYSLKEYYYYYKNMSIYSLKSFDTFIDLIDNGIVVVTFKTGVCKSGKYQGKFQDHGTAFRISKNNLEKLFDKLY